MKRTLIINDLHEGVQRAGGTTVQSAIALRTFAHENHRQLLRLAASLGIGRLIYNGDLTDTYDIPLTDAIQIFADVREFMVANPHIEVVWGEGNHDLSKDSSRLGTVAFIGMVLKATFPDRFRLVELPTSLDDGLYIIPHLANQELFDAALAAVPDYVKYLLLHCNWDNTFAGLQDHSLNLSRDAAKELKRRGMTLILGHEHLGRELMGGSVIITGNQFPTSVADCLSKGDAQKDGKKYCLLLDEFGTTERLQTWSPDQEGDGWFAEVDWRALRDTTEDGRGFIRVTGEASALEAADVVKEISWFRQRAQSFVITNAVKIEKGEGMEDLPDSMEDIQAVDVMGLLYGMLEPDQVEVLEKLGGDE